MKIFRKILVSATAELAWSTIRRFYVVRAEFNKQIFGFTYSRETYALGDFPTHEEAKNAARYLRKEVPKKRLLRSKA